MELAQLLEANRANIDAAYGSEPLANFRRYNMRRPRVEIPMLRIGERVVRENDTPARSTASGDTVGGAGVPVKTDAFESLVLQATETFPTADEAARRTLELVAERVREQASPLELDPRYRKRAKDFNIGGLRFRTNPDNVVIGLHVLENNEGETRFGTAVAFQRPEAVQRLA